MNEKLALIINSKTTDPILIQGLAKGYLEALENTKGIIEDFKDFLVIENPTTKDYHTILKSLNQWEKDK